MPGAQFIEFERENRRGAKAPNKVHQQARCALLKDYAAFHQDGVEDSF
jgi:hypothetical protein